jgi:ketosteroid isomerase-like protein
MVLGKRQEVGEMSAPEAAAARAVEAEEAGLQGALMGPDLQWFEEHWVPDAIYVHMSGGVDDREEFIERLRSKATEYFRRETGDVQMRQYGRTVIVTGWSSINIAVRGERRDLDTRFTRVYVEDQGNWRLAASQSGAATNNPPVREPQHG